MTNILRLPAILAKTGKTRSPLYADIARGTFTKPVKLSIRAAGWPEHEVEAINAARVAGASDSDLRKLVCKLHEARRATQPVCA